MEGMDALLWGLGPVRQHVTLQLMQETDSTNLRLKEWARQGAIRAPYLLIAESQTQGRGRLGRAFISPPGTGLYMSLLCRPEGKWQPGKITILAAVSVCLAIEELTGLQPKIKWVNDLFLRGKKICGILAEAVGDQVIVGVGVNLLSPPGGFPKEAGIAGALDAKVDRLLLAGKIAGIFLDGMEKLDDPGILQAYRDRMPLSGKEIQYSENGIQKYAHVLGVDESGGLLIRDGEGEKMLRTGEVTLGSYAFSGLE